MQEFVGDLGEVGAPPDECGDVVDRTLLDRREMELIADRYPDFHERIVARSMERQERDRDQA